MTYAPLVSAFAAEEDLPVPVQAVIDWIRARILTTTPSTYVPSVVSGGLSGARSCAAPCLSCVPTALTTTSSRTFCLAKIFPTTGSVLWVSPRAALLDGRVPIRPDGCPNKPSSRVPGRLGHPVAALAVGGFHVGSGFASKVVWLVGGGSDCRHGAGAGRVGAGGSTDRGHGSAPGSAGGTAEDRTRRQSNGLRRACEASRG